MILIFTEALLSSGLGHLGRCTALAEQLNENGCESVEIILQTDYDFPKWEYPCPVTCVNWLDEKSLTSFLIDRSKSVEWSSPIFYVDSYLAKICIYALLKNHCEELICIDDDYRLDYPPGSTLLNPGFPGLFLDYDRSVYRILTGKERVLLRKPFREKFVINLKNRPPKNVLITLGGTDTLLYSGKFLEILVENFPHLIKSFVIGAAFTNEENLRKIADENTIFYKNLSALQMRNLMLSTDFAITAGGQTTYELDVCGVPMVMIKTAENQMGNIRGFVEKQGVRHIKEPLEILEVFRDMNLGEEESIR